MYHIVNLVSRPPRWTYPPFSSPNSSLFFLPFFLNSTSWNPQSSWGIPRQPSFKMASQAGPFKRIWPIKRGLRAALLAGLTQSRSFLPPCNFHYLPRTPSYFIHPFLAAQKPHRPRPPACSNRWACDNGPLDTLTEIESWEDGVGFPRENIPFRIFLKCIL